MNGFIPMMGALAREEARVRLIERLRYPWGILGSVIFLASIYAAMAGLRAMLGLEGRDPSAGPLSGGLFTGVLFWLIIAGSATRVAAMFGRRFDDGLLELLMVSNIPFWGLLTTRMFSTLVATLVVSGLLIAGFQFAATTDPLPLGRVLAIVFWTELAAIGLGLGIGGMSLHLKKIGPVTGMMYAWTALWLVFAGTRADFAAWIALVPVFGPVHLLLADPAQVSTALWAGIAVSSLASLAVGALAFSRFLTEAKRRGTIYLS